MTDKSVSTQGSKLEIGTGAGGGTFVQVNGFTDWSGLGEGSAATIDTTDLSSTRKEKAMGVADEGDISISLIILPKDAGQIAMRAARGTRAATKFKLTYSDSTVVAFTAYVSTFGRNGQADDVIRGSSTLIITGEAVETAA